MDTILACPFTGQDISSRIPTYRPADDVAINLIGRSFGGYTIQQLIGAGAMGAVYGAVADNGVQVAMKVMLPRFAANVAACARLVREAAATSRVEHEHVVRVFETIKTPDGLPCIVMERLHGESLAAMLARDNYLALGHTLVLIDQVLAGLSAAHDVGVIHRDVKPENIFLANTERGTRAKVVDFGISRQVGETPLTEQGDVLGTPEYLAPEQATGGPVDHRVDIWAVGVLFYELLTGELPFSADTIAGVVHNIVQANPPPPEGPLPIVAVVMRALEKNPNGRFQSASEMRRALLQVGPDLKRMSLPKARIDASRQTEEHKLLLIDTRS